MAYFNINVENIKELLAQNYYDRINAEILMQRRNSPNYNPYEGGWSRYKFYQDINADLYHDGCIMQFPEGDIILQAKRRFYYRGENRIYPTSQSSLARKLNQCKTEEEKDVENLIANLKIREFANIIDVFDNVNIFKQFGITVLYEQLAQHYGFPTYWLDITSDFEVALFFACCKFENNEWKPFKYNEWNGSEITKYGTIIRRPTDIFWDMCDENPILPIGFQPFMRCSNQSAYAKRMALNDDFKTVQGVDILRFEHNESLSQWIYEKMDGGAKIYPSEKGLNIIQDDIDNLIHRKEIDEEVFDLFMTDIKDNDRSKKEWLRLCNLYGYQIKKCKISISQSKQTQINEIYKDFDIEHFYGIKLGARKCILKSI